MLKTILDDILPHDVCELLDSCIDSVAALDALALLHGDPAKWWAPTELARSLDISVDAALQAVVDLRGRGIADTAAAGTLFRLATLEPLAHAAFADLLRAYARERAAVVEHVSRRSIARLRMLADAFTSGPWRQGQSA